MTRKLASIQRVRALEPIEGADRIEVARVLGWSLVVRKGDFEVGDLCVYVELDSILPERPEFEFLRPRGFRVRTIKLRGQVSQGLALPLSVLPDGTRVEEGDDVTELLGVRKWEPPETVKVEPAGPFPEFLPKTDETRVQAVPGVLERHQGTRFYVTEKVDGTSATFYLVGGRFGTCSRNYEVAERENDPFWSFARKVGLRERMGGIDGDFALQGELLGPKVQRNRYGLEERNVFFFNAYDVGRRRYLDYEEFRELVVDRLGLDVVPLVDDDFRLPSTVDELVKFADAPSALNPEVPREGLVIRSAVESVDPELGRLSFKVLNPRYLLKYEA
ncbi:MAG: RNA ligase (ATP) [Promethearchaeota archaeon]